MGRSRALALGMAASITFACSGWAAPTAEEIARLGKDLTPVGAERAGNKEGTIPAWEGGMPTPAGWKVGDPRPDPFKSEQKLFSIDAKNVDKYKDKLTDGEIYLLKNKPNYRMDVYPSHRTCSYPDWFYERTIAHAGKANIAADGWRIENVAGATVPFPIPKSGAEAAWNFKLRWQGEGKIEYIVTVTSSKGGELNATWQTNHVLTPLGDRRIETPAQADNLEWEIINEVTNPPARLGELILNLNYIDRPSGDAWLYFPGQRRVRRAPTFSYDNPVPGYENLEMVDQYPMFAGAIDRYDWKILGKQEMYVPYNSYKLRERRKDLHDIYLPEYTNPDAMRYELHRIWKVEGTVKSDRRHNAARRIFYLDEDSWQMVYSDLYDAQGKLWRIQEGSIWVAWELPACVSQEFITYDLSVNRYLADNLTQISPETDWLAGREGRVTKNIFDPGELRRQGDR